MTTRAGYPLRSAVSFRLGEGPARAEAIIGRERASRAQLDGEAVSRERV